MSAPEPTTDPVKRARRQLRPVRTEVEVGAEVLLRLFDTGILGSTPKMIARISEITGIPVLSLRKAKEAIERRGYLVPVDVITATERPAPAPAAPTPKRPKTGGRPSRQADPASGQAICSTCLEAKPIEEFKVRGDRPHLRWTVCDACRSAGQRSRYLSVQRREALNAARLTFTIVEGDDQLACLDCGRPFEPGQRAYGDAGLHHEECPT